MKRWRHRSAKAAPPAWGRGAALLALLLSTQAGAQGGRAGPGDVCALPDQLLEVRLGASVRGTLLVKVEGEGGADGALGPGGRVWVEATALQSTETPYSDASLTCVQTPFVRLRPELQPRIDPETLTLRLLPVPALLPTQQRALGDTADQSAALARSRRPLFSVNYALSGWGDLSGGRPGNVTADVSAQVLMGPWSALVGAERRWGVQGSERVQPYAAARYQPDARWSVQAQYARPNAVPAWRGALSGVSARAERPYLRFWPELSVSLPLGGEYELRIDGDVIERGQAGAGTLRWTNLPLRRPRGQIEVEVTDDEGTRTVSQPYDFPAQLQPPRGYAAVLEAGWLASQGEPGQAVALTPGSDPDASLIPSPDLSPSDPSALDPGTAQPSRPAPGAPQWGEPYAGAALSYGLTPGLTVQAAGAWKGQDAYGELWAVLAPGGSDLRFGVAGRRTAEAWRGAGLVQLQRRFGRSLLSVRAAVPFDAPSQAQVRAALAYSGERFGVGAAVEYDGVEQFWLGRVDARYRVNQAWSVQGYAQLKEVRAGSERAPRGWSAGVNLQFRPNERLQLQQGAAASAGGRPEARTRLEYAPSPGQRLRAETNWRAFGVSYEYVGQVSASAGASSTGQLSGALSGSVVVAGGAVFLSGRSAQAAYVQLRTGLPGVAIYTGGLFQGRTDRRGQLILGTDQFDRPLVISIKPNELPLEVEVGEANLTLTLPGPGSYEADWQENFRVMRWVQLLWAPGEPAGEAELTIGAQTFATDRDGYVLIPRVSGPQEAAMRSLASDGSPGTRSCRLTLSEAEQAVCRP